MSTSTLLSSAVLALALFAPFASAALTEADVGNWTVGDCILAQFAMELTAHPPNRTNVTEPPLRLTVPVTAKADRDQSNCNLPDDKQTLTLSWSEKAGNGTDMLARNITIVFAKLNDSSTVPSYGIQRFYGVFELAHFQQSYSSKNKTELLNITSYIDVDTGDKGDKIMFRTPINRSFLCARIDPFEVPSHIHYTFPDAPPQGTKLPNATRVDTLKVQFDAFRPKDAPAKNFQVPMDCDYQPNDIVPIVVGVCLAGLVVFVIIAYIIGRRRHRQRGYQSV